MPDENARTASCSKRGRLWLFVCCTQKDSVPLCGETDNSNSLVRFRVRVLLVQQTHVVCFAVKWAVLKQTNERSCRKDLLHTCRGKGVFARFCFRTSLVEKDNVCAPLVLSVWSALTQNPSRTQSPRPNPNPTRLPN